MNVQGSEMIHLGVNNCLTLQFNECTSERLVRCHCALQSPSNCKLSSKDKVTVIHVEALSNDMQLTIVQCSRQLLHDCACKLLLGWLRRAIDQW